MIDSGKEAKKEYLDQSQQLKVPWKGTHDAPA
jgi:hypothetical protein